MRKNIIKFVLGACVLYMGASFAYDRVYKEEIKQKNEEASAAKILTRSLTDKIPTKAWVDNLKKQNSSIYVLRTCEAGKTNLMARYVHVDDAQDPFEVEQITDAFAFGKKSWLELLVDVENSSYSQYELNAEDKLGAKLRYSSDENLFPGEVIDYSLDNLNQALGSRFTENFCVKNYIKNNFSNKSSYTEKINILFKSANLVLNKEEKDEDSSMSESTYVFKSKEDALNFLSVVKSYMPEAEQAYRRFNSTECTYDTLKSTQQIISFGFISDNLSIEIKERVTEKGEAIYSMRAVEV